MVSGATRPRSRTRRPLRPTQLAITFVTYLMLCIGLVIFLFPFYNMIIGSFKDTSEIMTSKLRLLPKVWKVENLVELFRRVPFQRNLLNTLIVATISTALSLFLCSLGGFAFAKLQFPGRNILLTIMLSTMMIPAIVTFIPQYLLFFNLKLIDTYVPLTIGAWLGGGAFMIFLLRQFIMSIPRDLDEAATIDGAGPFRILWSVLVPLMKPALTTVAILQFLTDWNDFFGPFIYLNTMTRYTAAVGLRTFQNMALETTDPRDHLLMAGAAIMTIPVLVLFAVAQRYFVSGVVLSGLKV